ncbi:MAG: ATP-binding domain-containing protein, partial [Butyrivibrio sp.]|nr:ATP-binding domain-containing protein [Butyrivibrio sp.]
DTEDESESAPGSDKAADNLIENDFGGALKCIRSCSFVNVKHIASRILGREDVTAAEWLYTRMLLTGMADKNMRYVMVDEIQDYTMAQLQVLFKYYPNARFMLLGDEFQSIRRGTLTFDAIEEFAKGKNKSFALLPLMTSYRCSPEITGKFAAILPDAKTMLVSSVKRPGEKTFSKACSSDKEYYAELKKLIKEYSEMDGLTAVICRNPLNIEKIISALGKEAPSEITLQDALPSKGAFLIELALAKGLEFDHVILADADQDNYPGDEIGRHSLYTAMSRATQHLAILAKGKLAEKA